MTRKISAVAFAIVCAVAAHLGAQPLTLRTLAGGPGGTGWTDGPPSQARFESPSGLAFDAAGNLYVADLRTVRKITPTGDTSTVIGDANDWTFRPGSLLNARMLNVQDVAVDPDGILWVSTNQGFCRVDRNGYMTTIPNAYATGGVAVSPTTGDVYLASARDGGNCIRRVNRGTLAVSDFAACSGTTAVFGSGNMSLAFAPNGDLWVAGSSPGVVHVGTDGSIISTFGGGTAVSVSADGRVFVGVSYGIEEMISGNLTLVAGQSRSTSVASASDNAIGTSAVFESVRDLAFGPDGNLYVVDAGGAYGGASTIRKFNLATTAVTTVAGVAVHAGSVDGGASSVAAASFAGPRGIAVDGSGNVYVADTENNRVRKISSSGVSTIAQGLSYPCGVAVDPAGNVYIADTNNSCIRKVDPLGNMTLVASIGMPTALTIDASGVLWVNDWGVLRRVALDGSVTTPFPSVYLAYYTGVVATPAGVIYMAQTGGIKRIDTTTGLVETLSSTGGHGVAVDASGTVYYSVGSYSAVYRVNNGVSELVLGRPQSSGVSLWGTEDGTGTTARLNNPLAIAFGPDGALYIADTSNHKIRVARPALSDQATVDAGDAAPGDTVHLDISPSTASSWNWIVARRPSGSTAQFSTATVRNPTFTIDAPGLYTFRATATGTNAESITEVDVRGCSPLSSVSIAVGGNGQYAPVCYSSTAMNPLVATAVEGGVVSYRWGYRTVSGGTITYIPGATSSSYTVRGRDFPAAGPYYMVAVGTPQSGCGGDVVSNEYQVQINGAVIPLTAPSSVCASSSGNVISVPDQGTGASYSWSITGGTITTGWSTRQISFTAGTGASVAISLTATLNSCSTTESVTIPVLAAPTVGTISTSSSVCGGTYAFASIPSAGSGVTYRWSVSSGSISGSGTSTSVMYVAPASGPLTLTVTVTNTATGCSTSSSTNITVNPVPSATITLSPTGNVCPGTVMTASVPDAGTSAKYAWSLNGGPFITSGAGTRSITFTASVATTVAVTVTSSSGCSYSGSTAVPLGTSVLASSRGFDASGGSATIAVTNASQCAWASVVSANWISIANGSGSGNGTATITIAKNSASIPRNGSVTIAGTVVPIHQSGGRGNDGLGYNVTHLAGNTSGAGHADGTGTSARFAFPTGTAIDSANNVYVADTYNYTIRKITPDGAVTTFAGTAGMSGFADGTGVAARFSEPRGVAIDSANNVFITDSQTIRKITPAGVVTTFAGSPFATGNADGTGSAARFNNVYGIVVDRTSDTIYAADSGSHTIRQITSSGVVTTVAGLAGTPGEIDATGANARFNAPTGITIDPAGNLYVTDRSGPTIRKISAGGVVTTIAGAAGANGSSDGTGPAATFSSPNGIAIDSSLNLYVIDNNYDVIRKITPAGVVSSPLGGNTGYADGSGTGARFNFTTADLLSCDAAGNLIIPDANNHLIRKVSPDATVTTLAGTITPYPASDGSTFRSAMAIALDAAGNAYVADSNNYVVRKITPAGAVSIAAGQFGVYGSTDGAVATARLGYVLGIAVDPSGSTIFISDNANRIRKIAGGTVSTLAGQANAGAVDGTGTAAQFRSPRGLALDSAGNLYVADSGNSTIRKITPTGAVSTFAGQAGVSGAADGTGSGATFATPWSLAIDASGNIFVADQGNYLLRKITPAGAVTTIAGRVRSNVMADGSGTQAGFGSMNGIAVDGSGNVFVADSSVIRKVTSANVVTTVAGTPDSYGNTDGPSAIAQFYYAFGIAVDSAGKLYIADSSNAAVRLATTVPVLAVNAPAGFTATASSGSSVSMNWTDSAVADHYEIGLRQTNGTYTVVATSTSPTATATGLTADTAYVYAVRVIDSNGTASSYSTPDLATTTVFADDPIQPGITVVRAVHLTQARSAVNAVRAAAGLSPFSFTDPSVDGKTIKAVHMQELRTALGDARGLIGLPAMTYTNSVSAGSAIHAADLTDIRNGVK